MKSTSQAIALTLAATLLIALPGASIAADPSGQSASWNDYGVKNITNANLGSGAGFLVPETDTVTPQNPQIVPPTQIPATPWHPHRPLPPNRFHPPQIQNWPTPPDFGKPPSFGKPPMIPPLPPPGTQWDKPRGKPPGQGQCPPGHTDPELMRFLYQLWLMQQQGGR